MAVVSTFRFGRIGIALSGEAVLLGLVDDTGDHERDGRQPEIVKPLLLLGQGRITHVPVLDGPFQQRADLVEPAEAAVSAREFSSELNRDCCRRAEHRGHILHHAIRHRTFPAIRAALTAFRESWLGGK